MVDGFLSATEYQFRSSLIQAQAAYEAIQLHGAKPGALASEVGTSSAKIRDLARTYAAFSPGDSWLPMLSFQHHVIAARTDAPLEWLAQAHDNNWSTRDLQGAISMAKAGRTGDDERQSDWEHLVHRARRFEEKWGVRVEVRRVERIVAR